MKSTATERRNIARLTATTSLLLLSLLLIPTSHVRGATQSEGRRLRIINQSGKELAVDWVNPRTGDLVPISSNDVRNGQEVTFNSFVNHTFMVHEAKNETECAAGQPGGSSCAGSIIVVGEEPEQVALISDTFEVVFPTASPKLDREMYESAETIDDCKEIIQDRVEVDALDLTSSIEALADCMEGVIASEIHASNNEIEFQATLRLTVSDGLENHTCGNPMAETSEPVRTETWEHLGATRNVHILHDRPSSQIHAIEDFISAEECKAIEDAAEQRLRRGTVADGSGGHRLSDARKAMQAGVRVPWGQEHQGHPIVAVMRRLYNYTNHAVGYNLTVDGQEDLMAIQYFGRGKNATESPDQYRPHCDGDCGGFPHQPGARVATMVMYCAVPELGGGTNFQNSNVFVKPEVGSAAFFSYMNNETHVMENGFTTHSGCPVIEGTKRIAVHWMRIGVDKENPWSSFNTLTIQNRDD